MFSTLLRKAVSIFPIVFNIIRLQILTFSISAVFPVATVAQQISFQSYTQTEGLTDIVINCLRQDKTGYILACTQHGLYVYDGRRFFNLGPRQGLPEGGLLSNFAFTMSGNIVLLYSNRIYVAKQALSSSSSPNALTFRRAIDEGGTITSNSSELASWRDGALLINHGRLEFINLGTGSGSPTVQLSTRSLPPSAGVVRDAVTVIGQKETLWIARLDGRICSFSPASSRCYDSHDGLPAVEWRTFLADRDGLLIARSKSLLVTIDTHRNTVKVETLPYQGGRYDNYFERPVLTRTPSGQILTQSADGLMIRTVSGWTMLTTQHGLPAVPIFSVLFDRQANLWLGTFGRGVLKALGYGLWENWNHRDGLPDDTVWQITRQVGGALWAATDGGLDAVDVPEGLPLAHRNYGGPSYAVATGFGNHVWRSTGADGVSRIDTSTGEEQHFALPAVNKIVPGLGRRLWFITQKGIYFTDDASTGPASLNRLPDLTGAIDDAVSAADGSLWLLHDGQLLHRHDDGSIVVVMRHWSQADFNPLVIALQNSDVMWVGGRSGGLYRFRLVGDHVTDVTLFSPPEILSDTVVSVLVDRRGWVWAGSSNGVSVFNGKRWVSADMSDGLVWNDLTQNGLYQDTDGSIWISTSQGLSHLLHPAKLFEQSPLQPVITSVMLGLGSFAGRAVAYTQDPLHIQFGVLNYRSEGAIRFRYFLDGVDKAWADTSFGYARYPSVPPGHHLFSLVAYDILTHQVSAPVSIMLRVRQPWWLWWPLQVLYVVTGATLVYAVWHLRYRFLVQQQRRLMHEVELRTREIREAQAALVLQATQDSLTRLLTRGAIQKRLIEDLALISAPSILTVGLLDIDHFKRINDRFGHLAGDEILREIGERLQALLDIGEYAGRYGGEEILIVLNGEHVPDPGRMCILNAAIGDTPFLVETETIPVTCSIGVAYTIGQDSWKSLIGRADKALYRAKALGRNRVVEAEITIARPVADAIARPRAAPMEPATGTPPGPALKTRGFSTTEP